MSDKDLLRWAKAYWDVMRISGTQGSKIGRLVEVAIRALEVQPNESRELCFARVILGDRPASDEVRALAEDTIARAKLKARRG